MPHVVQVEFDDFGWELIEDEASCQGVSVEDVVRHAALYFVADRDSDRLSRRVAPFKRREPRKDAIDAVSRAKRVN